MSRKPQLPRIGEPLPGMPDFVVEAHASDFGTPVIGAIRHTQTALRFALGMEACVVNEHIPSGHQRGVVVRILAIRHGARDCLRIADRNFVGWVQPGDIQLSPDAPVLEALQTPPEPPRSALAFVDQALLAPVVLPGMRAKLLNTRSHLYVPGDPFVTIAEVRGDRAYVHGRVFRDWVPLQQLEFSVIAPQSVVRSLDPLQIEAPNVTS